MRFCPFSLLRLALFPYQLQNRKEERAFPPVFKSVMIIMFTMMILMFMMIIIILIMIQTCFSPSVRRVTGYK